MAVSLIIDGSRGGSSVGVVRDSGDAVWSESGVAASCGIFEGIERIFGEAGVEAKDVLRVYFCEGAGSALGIRAGASFVRTLMALQEVEVLAYRSLELVSAHLGGAKVACECGGKEALICEPAGQGYETRIVGLGELEEMAGESKVHWLEGRRKKPEGVEVFEYKLEALWETLEGNEGLLRDCEAPDLWEVRKSQFKKWEK